MSFNINNLNFINYLFNSLTLPISLFMAISSLLTIYIIITKCNYKYPEMILIIVMNLLHIYCGISELTGAIAKMSFGYQYLRAGTIQCLIFSFLIISSARFELFTIGYLAFMRYSIICNNTKKKYKILDCIIFIGYGAYICNVSYPLLTFDANPSSSMLYCAPYLKPTPKEYIISTVNSFIFVIPCWTITYCYFLIGIKSYKKLNSMKNEGFRANDEDLVDRISKQKRSLILQLLVVFTVFNLAYMPVYITMILRITLGYKRPAFADAIVIKTMEISRAIDPLITIVFQPELNHEFQVFLTKSIARFKRFIVNLFN